jgi:hypothetical protein
MDVVQGEWIVKRRNCAAALNNRESKTEPLRNRCLFCLRTTRILIFIYRGTGHGPIRTINTAVSFFWFQN